MVNGSRISRLLHFKSVSSFTQIMKVLTDVLNEEEDMTVWVSDDKNRIVIRAEAEILVGSLKMDLKGYSGLANLLTSKIR